MRLQPKLAAKDLMRLFEISERSSRRRIAAVIKKNEQRRNGFLRINQNPGGSRPYLVDADDVVAQFALARETVKSYIKNQVRSSLFALMDACDASKVLEGRWMKRNVWFAVNYMSELCIKRLCYFSLKGSEGNFNPDMKRIGITVFPVALFAAVSRNYLKELYGENEFVNGLCEVFYEADLTTELVGYLSKMTGRNNPVGEIVLIDELEYGDDNDAQEVVQGLLQKLGEKIGRKRSLVFLPDSLIPDHSEYRLWDTGFQKLGGTRFYISGGIEKFKEVKFRVWYATYGE